MDFNARLQEFQVELTALLDKYRFGIKEEVVFTDQLGNLHLFESPILRSRMRVIEREEPKTEQPKKKKHA